MANIVVSGAAGRMGRLIVAIIMREGQHRLTGALEAPGNPLIGQDAGEVAGAGRAGLAI